MKWTMINQKILVIELRIEPFNAAISTPRPTHGYNFIEVCEPVSWKWNFVKQKSKKYIAAVSLWETLGTID